MFIILSYFSLMAMSGCQFTNSSTDEHKNKKIPLYAAAPMKNLDIPTELLRGGDVISPHPLAVNRHLVDDRT